MLSFVQSLKMIETSFSSLVKTIFTVPAFRHQGGLKLVTTHPQHFLMNIFLSMSLDVGYFIIFGLILMSLFQSK